MSKVSLRQVGMKKVEWKKVGWRQSDNTLDYPDGAVLYFKAADGLTNQVDGPNLFKSSVLPTQYVRKADGSYAASTDIVDVIGGRKYLRTCGQVQNLLPSGSAWGNVLFSASAFTGGKMVPTTLNTEHYGSIPAYTFVSGTIYTLTCDVKEAEYTKIRLSFPTGIAPSDDRHAHFDLVAGTIITKGVNVTASIEKKSGGISTISITRQATASGVFVSGYIANLDSAGNISFAGDGVGGIFLYTMQLTATAYPQPYTPPGTTMPASHATASGGPWFDNPENSEAWKCLTNQTPGMTLATKMLMGVGSGDLPNNMDGNVLSPLETATRFQFYSSKIQPEARIVYSNDGGAAYPTVTGTPWLRNTVITRFTQVNTAGTQFRVGYMIEGTHTTIQWSSWVAFDGSFNPSTLYRILLGFNNIYPQYYDTIILYRAQIADSKLISDMGA